MKIYYTVYKITNNLNGKYYVGKHQTKDLQDEYLGSGLLIKAAISKYGAHNFTKEILHIFDTRNAMDQKERELVVVSEETYNLAEGGNGGAYLKGIPHSDETRLKMSLSKLGHKHSNETKAKMSTAHSGENNSFYGRKHTAETKKKMVLARTGLKRSEETKAKMRTAAKLRTVGKFVKGQPKSAETRQRMKDAWILRKTKKELTNVTTEL